MCRTSSPLVSFSGRHDARTAVRKQGNEALKVEPLREISLFNELPPFSNAHVGGFGPEIREQSQYEEWHWHRFEWNCELRQCDRCLFLSSLFYFCDLQLMGSRKQQASVRRRQHLACSHIYKLSEGHCSRPTGSMWVQSRRYEVFCCSFCSFITNWHSIMRLAWKPFFFPRAIG